jgi:AcrR family transcriptional regulator
MNPDERREQILKCAKKLFSTRGYYNTQISDIIDEAKIARGTLYQYFENKDDILVTLLEDFYNKWVKSIAVNSKNFNLDQVSAKQYFHHRVKETLLFFRNDIEICNIALRMGMGLSDVFQAIIDKFEKKIINLISDDIRLGIKLNNIRKDLNIELTANIMAAALFRLSYFYFVSSSGRKSKIDIDSLSSEIVDTFIPGIFIPKSQGK